MEIQNQSQMYSSLIGSEREYFVHLRPKSIHLRPILFNFLTFDSNSTSDIISDVLKIKIYHVKACLHLATANVKLKVKEALLIRVQV